MPQLTDRMMSWLSRRPLLTFVALYGALAILALLADRVLTGPLQRAVESLTHGAGLGAYDPGNFVRSRPEGPPPNVPMWAVGTVSMSCAGLLALPIAWMYTITRQKRGYNQSVVQSLILLPVVVAGVVVLVKFSLALAFSLAGIVAAVRFRNTLEDSKDAVYIFAVTGIGLASGVELSSAAALSVLFNFTTLMLFLSDFGRTPARLEGEMAEERMRRALAVANRTSQFVTRLDEEILEEMAPEQLEAVASRAWQRRREATTGAEHGSGAGRMDQTLRVRTGGGQAARDIVQGLLQRQTKRWQLLGAQSNDSGEELTYALRLRKSVAPQMFLDSLRTEGANFVLDAELK